MTVSFPFVVFVACQPAQIKCCSFQIAYCSFLYNRYGHQKYQMYESLCPCVPCWQCDSCNSIGITLISVNDCISFIPSSCRQYLNCVSKNVPLYILNNSAKYEPIVIIFGVRNPEEISRQKIINSPTSPECRRTTLWNAKVAVCSV